MDSFMKRAVQLSLGNVQEGGRPFGAVLVKDDQIVSEGVNELHRKHDISGHAEMLAIRRAQEKLQTNDLSGYTMYASGEPCPMCLIAMYMTGIRDLYYCQSMEETAEYGMGKSVFLYEELSKDRADREMNSEQMPLTEEQSDPMRLWQERNEQTNT